MSSDVSASSGASLYVSWMGSGSGMNGGLLLLVCPGSGLDPENSANVSSGLLPACTSLVARLKASRCCRSLSLALLLPIRLEPVCSGGGVDATVDSLRTTDRWGV